VAKFITQLFLTGTSLGLFPGLGVAIAAAAMRHFRSVNVAQQASSRWP
jgi:hypothetical protein